jgi:hypothetical protein
MVYLLSNGFSHGAIRVKQNRSGPFLCFVVRTHFYMAVPFPCASCIMKCSKASATEVVLSWTSYVYYNKHATGLHPACELVV